METVTISLEKYERLIETEKKLLKWHVEVNDNLIFIGNDFDILKKMSLSILEKRRINQSENDKKYYKKQMEKISEKERDLKSRERSYEVRKSQLDWKEKRIDEKWIWNALFRVWFFILVFVVFLETKVLFF